ncbi:MAG: GTPase [Bacteroidetes bacterium]|nr:GTPase [Bacteroidota bacterium]
MVLIFVYNAKSDVGSKLFDYAHKVLSPSTYSCNLCALTHSIFGQRNDWKEFAKYAPFEMKFYHLDEFERMFNKSFEYPVVLQRDSNKVRILVDNKAINRLTNINDLISLINKHTKSHIQV